MPKTETFNRSKVLDQATLVFHTKGFNGTSIQDLVDATGLNRSSIYNSFGNKLQMFKEVLSHYQNYHTINFNSGLSSCHNASESLHTFFELNLREILNDGDQKGCMILNCKSEMTNRETSIKNFMEYNQDCMIGLLKEIVDAGQKEKLFNTEKTADQYALYLFSAIQGLRMLGILHKNEEELRSVIHTVTKALY